MANANEHRHPNQIRFEESQLCSALLRNEAQQEVYTREIADLNERHAIIEANAASLAKRNHRVPPDYKVGQDGCMREIASLSERLATLKVEAEAIRVDLTEFRPMDRADAR